MLWTDEQGARCVTHVCWNFSPSTASKMPSAVNYHLKSTFQTHLYNIFKQAVIPGVLQTFSTCAVKQ